MIIHDHRAEEFPRLRGTIGDLAHAAQILTIQLAQFQLDAVTRLVRPVLPEAYYIEVDLRAWLDRAGPVMLDGIYGPGGRALWQQPPAGGRDLVPDNMIALPRPHSEWMRVRYLIEQHLGSALRRATPLECGWHDLDPLGERTDEGRSLYAVLLPPLGDS